MCKILLRINKYQTIENLLKSVSLLSASRQVSLHRKNLNETKNALSPGLLKILNSIFQSINMDVDHKLLLHLFLIGFWLFFGKI